MRSLLIALLVLGACSAPPARIAPKPTPAPERFRVARPDPILEDRRLPRTLVPIAYRPHLAIGQREITATIAIDARLTEPTDTIWLDARALAIKSARVGNVRLEPRVIDNPTLNEQKLALLAASPLPAGHVTIEIEYTAPIEDIGTIDPIRPRQAGSIHGAFRETFEGHSYLFTMFEPFYARRVFPCVDEPDRRARWTLTLDVPADEVAVGNAAVVRETALDANTKRLELAPTEPLPSYLIAFAVGPFDIVEGTPSSHGTPIRLLAQRGRGLAAKHAVDAVAPILDAAVAWMSMPYPFSKLDIVSVPLTGHGWFAMENPGLVTVGETGVRAARPGSDLEWVFTMTHEVAHHWFGDLVTLAWWNDIWLNEGFTTWMTDKIVRQLRPSSTDMIASVRSATALLESRGHSWLGPVIRVPMADSFSFDKLLPYFSGERGAAFIASLEAFVGPDAFRNAIHAYLARHRFGVATTNDVDVFLTSVHPELAGVIASTVDKPGAPRLSVELACAKKQSVARLSGTPGWKIPACLAFDSAGTRAERCVVVDGTAEITFATCPRWISPNPSGSGFYHTAWTAALAEPLARHGWPHLSPRERARAMIEIEGADAQIVLGAALALMSANTTDPAARAWIATTLAAHLPKVPDDLRPALATALEPTLARVRAFDLSAEATLDERVVRAAELELAATLGDPALVARGASLLANLSRSLSVYWPWIRLLAARADHSLIPALLSSSLNDNAATLSRIPGIARLVPPSQYTPFLYMRLLERGCSDTERADAIATPNIPPAVLAKPIDTCIAERARLEPTFRAWLGKRPRR